MKPSNGRFVDSIPVSQVNRYLRSAALQPHRSRYRLNTKEKDPEVFQRQVEIVCQTYQEAPELYFPFQTHTVCADGMTSVQALERTAETIPLQPGRPERMEFEYKRHGTVCLIGNWDVVQGQMIAPTIRATGCPLGPDEDFCRHIHNTVQTGPEAGWVFVVDRWNIHCSEALVRYAARLEGIDEGELGKKSRSGILKSMAARQEFLSDRNHRVRFVSLPKHSSWLNRIETVFGILQRRVLRRGNFLSTTELQERLFEFIKSFNETFAKPFNWTYTGRPVAAARDQRAKTGQEKWAAKREARKAIASMAH